MLSLHVVTRTLPLFSSIFCAVGHATLRSIRSALLRTGEFASIIFYINLLLNDTVAGFSVRGRLDLLLPIRQPSV